MERIAVAPGDAWLNGRRPFLRLLAEAAATLGGRLEMESRFGHAGWYHPPKGPTRPIFGNALGLNVEAAAMLATDKDYTARLLAAEGVPTPSGQIVFSPAYRARMALKNAGVARAISGAEAAAGIAAGLGYPVILKPNTGSEGRGVHLCASEVDLHRNLALLFETDDRVRIEARVPGEDVRVTVLDGAVRLAYRRQPLSVTGDGERPVSALIAERLDALADAHRGAKLAQDDPRIAQTLVAQGVDRASVPAAGARVSLLQSANLSTGGTAEDLGDALPKVLSDLAVRAARHLGLRLAGVDLLVPELSQTAGGAHVLEVNAAPGLDYYASAGPVCWASARRLLIDALSA